MRKRYPTNRKVYGMLILAFILLVVLIFLAYKVVKIKNIKRVTSRVYTYEQGQKNIDDSDQKSSVSKRKSPTFNNAYKNQRYAYSVAYDDSWHVSSDLSEEALENKVIDGRKVSIGGQTFWSNYKNINDYAPDNKPEDFHLLGLTIYEADDINVDGLAALIGFDSESILKKDVFEGREMKGTEFVAPGINEQNPQVMIIFQKDKRFYVFNLDFINGDAQAAETMENITRTLVLK